MASLPVTKVVGNSVNKNQGKSQWLHNFTWPSFSVAIQQDIEKKILTAARRASIISTIGQQMWGHTQRPTSLEYTAICRMLIDKYSFMEDLEGNGIASWKLQLRQWFSNRRRPSKNIPYPKEIPEDSENLSIPPAEDSENLSILPAEKRPCIREGDTFDNPHQVLERESTKQEPSPKILKERMKDTFTERRRWIQTDSPSLSTVLDVYPSLRKYKYLCRELESIAEELGHPDSGQLLDSAEEKWAELLPLIKVYAKLEKWKVSQNIKANPDWEGFELLSALLGGNKTIGVSATYCLTECSFENEIEEIDVTYPYIGIVKGGEKLQFLLIAEKIVVCTTKTFLEAVFGMMALYFMLDISYPRSLNSLLIFIQHIIMALNDGDPPAELKLHSLLMWLQKE